MPHVKRPDVHSPATMWTTPDELREQLLSHWSRGTILAAAVTGAPLFPLTLALRRPRGSELGQRFEAVRGWIRELEDHSRAAKGFGYDILWTEINHRQLGRNRTPRRVVVITERDALRLIGKERDGRRFRELAAMTTAQFPSLGAFLARRPHTVLENAGNWPAVLAVLAWFRDHPRSDLYLRQVDISGVDTKFVEARKALFCELLDVVLGRAGDAPTGRGRTATFEERYGLRTKPALVRFRALDPALAVMGLSDLTVPVRDFAALGLAVRHVFITENEINGLAFPAFPGAIVIFGLGYGLDVLQGAAWLQAAHILYWGDIDTHGFVMLDRLRHAFPGAHALLMDRATLMAHRTMWVTEPAPARATLSRLTPDEQALFGDLVDDRLGKQVRLEQERVSYACLEKAIAAID